MLKLILQTTINVSITLTRVKIYSSITKYHQVAEEIRFFSRLDKRLVLFQSDYNCIAFK